MSRKLLLLAGALCAAVGLLAEQKRCLGAETSTAEQKIEEALNSPTQLDMDEMPLQEVLSYLKDRHHIEIQVDRKALDEVGLDPSTLPMTKHLQGISLRSALNLMLHDLDLTYVVRDQVLLITTPEAAAELLSTKVYPVADLVAADDQKKQAQQREVLIHVITATIVPEGWAGAAAPWGRMPGGMGMGGYGGYGPGRYAGPAGPPPRKAEAGGKGTVVGASFGGVPVLIVLQTYHAHRQIAALLSELRRVAGVKCPTPPKSDKQAAHVPAAKPPAGGAASPPDDPFSR